jgi:hypothetical protein
MRLDDSDQIIKDKIFEIMSGEWDDNFDIEHIEKLRRRSFLLNNVRWDGADIIFEWNGYKVNVHSTDIMEMSMFWADTFEHIFSSIISDPVFIGAYASFYREWMIDRLLK